MDKLGEIAGNAVNNTRDKYEKNLDRCQYWDDDRLIQKARSASTSLVEKMACIKELQNRGYSAEDFR